MIKITNFKKEAASEKIIIKNKIDDLFVYLKI
jgi:hypothetical protein